MVLGASSLADTSNVGLTPALDHAIRRAEELPTLVVSISRAIAPRNAHFPIALVAV